MMVREAAMLGIVTWVLLGGCRGYHDPLPFTECQPYALQCSGCTFVDDVEDDAAPDRVWRCDTDDGRTLDAVRRAAIDTVTATYLDAEDTHFYDVETGLRVAAVREWAEVTDVCGRDLDEEWYGEILGACDPVCEHDPSLPGADGALPSCNPVI